MKRNITSVALQANEKKTVKQAFFYLVIGASSALFELLLFTVLYYAFNVDVALSNVIAVVCAAILNFTLNGRVTFKTSTNIIRSAVLYALLFLFNTCFSTVAISLLVSAGMLAPIAKVITMACIVLWNFILYKKVIFK